MGVRNETGRIFPFRVYRRLGALKIAGMQHAYEIDQAMLDIILNDKGVNCGEQRGGID